MTRTSLLCRTAARYGLYAVLGGWFSVSLLGQDPLRRHDRVRRFDRLNLVVPDWRFFAPAPGIHDVHLLYRDELAGGAATGWREVSRIEDRRLRQVVWHPHRRTEKVLVDVVAELLRCVGEDGADRAVLLSVPYLTLLHHVSGPQRGHHPDAAATQFLLAVSAGHDEGEEPVMVFLSEWHPLEGVGPPAGSTQC